MWRDVFNFAGRLWGLLEDTRQNKAEIKQMRQELRMLAFEVRRLAEHGAHEREKLLLKLENQLLRFERRLPGGKHKASGDGPATGPIHAGRKSGVDPDKFPTGTWRRESRLSPCAS